MAWRGGVGRTIASRTRASNRAWFFVGCDALVARELRFMGFDLSLMRGLMVVIGLVAENLYFLNMMLNWIYESMFV